MSHFITVEDLLADPEPLDIDTGKRVKDKKSGNMVDATLRFYARRPSDIEKEKITKSANIARRNYRKALLDESTEEHQLLLRESLEEASDDDLRRLWVQGNLLTKAAEIQLMSLEEREVVPEPEGDIIPADVRDANDEAVEAAETDRLTLFIQALESAQRELEEEAKAIPHEALLTTAMPAHAEMLAQGVWNDVYTANLLYRCTFTDKDYRKRAFETVAQVDAMKSQKPRVYRQLADHHKALLLELEPTLGN